jgi:hypothetical protein
VSNVSSRVPTLRKAVRIEFSSRRTVARAH